MSILKHPKAHLLSWLGICRTQMYFGLFLLQSTHYSYYVLFSSNRCHDTDSVDSSLQFCILFACLIFEPFIETCSKLILVFTFILNFSFLDDRQLKRVCIERKMK